MLLFNSQNNLVMLISWYYLIDKVTRLTEL